MPARTSADRAGTRGGLLADGYLPASGEDILLSAGADPARLYLNGQEVDRDGYRGGLTGNEEPLVIGVRAWLSGRSGGGQSREPSSTGATRSRYFDQALTAQQIARRDDAGVGSAVQHLVDDGGVQAAVA
jgi:hypothetical protein